MKQTNINRDKAEMKEVERILAIDLDPQPPPPKPVVNAP